MLAPRADAPAGTRHAHGATGFLGGLALPAADGAQAQSADPEAVALARSHAYFAGQAALDVELADTQTTRAPHGIVTQHVQTLGGLPIEGTFATALLRDDQLVFARHLLVVPPQVDLSPDLDVSAVAARALDGGRGAGLDGLALREGEPALTIAYFDGQAHLSYRMVARAVEPPGAYALYVDAHDGAFLGARKVSDGAAIGQVVATVNDACQDGATVEAPMPFIKLAGGQADAGGHFAAADSSTTVSLTSAYLRLADQSGALPSPWPFTLQAAPAANTLALTVTSPLAVDVYRNVMVMRGWLTAHEMLSSAQRAWASRSITANINLSSHCNAYYDGTLNFFSAGNGCVNTGTIPVVVHHEYGHGIQHNSGNGENFDGMVGEGLADVAAIFQGHGSGIPGLSPGCGGQLRTCVNTFSFCSSGCTYSPNTEIHTGGQAVCGAWYELRAGLEARYGQPLGTAQASALFLKHLTLISGNIADTYQAAVASDDDDDGNPANGTRHSCEINAAFAGANPHFPGIKGSLVPSSPSLAIAHQPPANVSAAGPLTLDVSLTPHPVCDPHPRLAAVVHYRVDAETTVRSAPLLPQGGGYRASLADVVAPATVHYWVDATLDGVAFRYPYPGSGAVDANAPAAIAQALRYGDDAVLVSQDFDADAGGALRTTDAADGRPDWEWGVPTTFGGDPLAAATGERVWALNLTTGGDTTGRPARTSTLTLAPVAVPEGTEAVHLQFWTTQLNPGAWRVEVNGTAVLSGAAVAGPRRDPGWRFEDVDVTAAVAGAPSAEVRFVGAAGSGGGAPVSFWAIDGVRVLATLAASGPGIGADAKVADNLVAAVRASTLGCRAAGPLVLGLALPLAAWRRLGRRRRS